MCEGRGGIRDEGGAEKWGAESSVSEGGGGTEGIETGGWEKGEGGGGGSVWDGVAGVACCGFCESCKNCGCVGCENCGGEYGFLG